MLTKRAAVSIAGAMLAGTLFIAGAIADSAQAQYYPQQPGYNPYGYQAAPTGYAMPTYPAGTPTYAAPAATYPPATTYPPAATYPPAPAYPPYPSPTDPAATYAYPPAATTTYPPATMPADSTTGSTATMTGTVTDSQPVTSYPAATYPTTQTYAPAPVYQGYATAAPATNMMMYSPTAAATMAPGLKFGYQSDAGDYFGNQPRLMARWEQFPLTMHLTFPEGMPDAEKEVVRAAVAEWQKHVDIALVEQPGQAKIQLAWVTQLSDDESLGMTEINASHMDAYGRTLIDRSTIKMLEPSRYVDVNPNVLKSAVMRQIGVALGLTIPSDNENDLMCNIPGFKRAKSSLMTSAVRSFANRTLGQLIDLQVPQTGNVRRRSTPPPDKVSRRDLNTLFRIYTQ